MHLVGTMDCFSYYIMGTVGATSGQLLRKVELAKMQDRLMDGSESWDN